jgi:hypothetical protein
VKLHRAEARLVSTGGTGGAFGPLLFSIIAVGIGMQALTLFRPINQPDWREADIAGVARNFEQEGMNPLYPRIDWRGDGPGFAEMEFPFLSWAMAVFYRTFGSDEIAGRILTFLVSLGTLAILIRLAGDLLGRLGVLAATAFYLTNPFVSVLSTRLQPEMWMMLGYVAAIRHFLLWTENGRRRDYVVAVAATSLAILAKGTAAHVGLLFLLIVVEQWGLKAFRDLRLWSFEIGRASCRERVYENV